MIVRTTVTSDDGWSVRRAGIGDTDAIAMIWRAGWIDGHAGRVPTELERARLDGSWQASARERIEGTWVACDRDGRVAGFVTVVGDELEQVYVAGNVRGTGVATMLLRHGERIVGSTGFDRAWLAVAAGNYRARRFYEREGWTDAGPLEYLAHTAAGAIPVSVRRYERALSSAQPAFKALGESA